jgi:Domain of unknown function (DUF5134)
VLLPPAVSWILTVTLAVAGGCFGYQCVRPVPGVAGRVSPVLHVTMCAAMVAMAWPWGTRVPQRPQAALFAAGALWFLVSAARARRMSRAVAHAHHTLMALVMVWMVAAPPAAHARAGHAGHAAMTGMTGPPPASVMFAAYFALAALVWLADAATATGPDRTVRRLAGAAGHAAMSAGAGVLTLAMS